MESNKFIDKCVDEKEDINNIDEYISKWKETETDMEIHEYLGMSENEYKSFRSNPNSLNDIIKVRRLLMESITTDIIENKEAYEESMRNEKEDFYNFIDRKSERIILKASRKAYKKVKDVVKRRKANKISKASRKKNRH